MGELQKWVTESHVWVWLCLLVCTCIISYFAFAAFHQGEQWKLQQMSGEQESKQRESWRGVIKGRSKVEKKDLKEGRWDCRWGYYTIYIGIDSMELNLHLYLVRLTACCAKTKWNSALSMCVVVCAYLQSCTLHDCCVRCIKWPLEWLVEY